MELSVDVLPQVEELKKHTNCRYDFSCIKSNFEDICKVHIFDPETAIECLEEKAESCNNSLLPFGSGYFCKCPIRHYIAKKLQK